MVSSKAPLPLQTPTARLHYLDNLRALAMLLGVVLHAGLAYAEPGQDFWIATDTRSSVAVDVSISFIHLFRMGLFFLLSGYFAKMMIERKGVKQFLMGRCIRLVLPFILFYPFLLAAMWIVVVFGLKYVPEPKGILGLIADGIKAAEAAKSNGEAAPANSAAGITTMHLWFIYYLTMFSLLAVVMRSLRMGIPDGWIDQAWKKPWLIGLLPMTLVPGVYAAGAPLPAPESFVPMGWPFIFYGLFYGAGWLLFGREGILDACDRYRAILLSGSLIAFVVYYRTLPDFDLSQIVQDATLPKPHWLTALLTAYLSVTLALSAILLGRRFLGVEHRGLRFVADASYWVYLIHLPVVLFLQMLWVPWDGPVLIKLSSTILVTLLVCFSSYVVFVRYTPIGRMLHGKRSFP